MEVRTVGSYQGRLIHTSSYYKMFKNGFLLLLAFSLAGLNLVHGQRLPKKLHAIEKLSSGERVQYGIHASVASASITMSSNLPVGSVGTPYSGVISASGGVAPYTFSTTAGALPTGLVLNSNTGAITGTPTIAVTKNFWVKVSDAVGGSSRLHEQITISSPSVPLTGISVAVSPTSASLTSGGTKQFSATVQGTSNTAVVWTATAGVVSTGGLFTAPKVTTSTSVRVTAASAADSTQTASATVTVSPAPTVSISISPLSASLGSGKSQQFSATVQGSTNTSVSWSASAGSISSGGMFTAPTVSSGTNVTVTATSAADSTKRASATVAVSAAIPPVAITTTSVPGAKAGTAYSFALAASGGSTPYQWAMAGGSLPQGFTFGSTGKLSGTTSQTGSFAFTAQVTDTGGTTSTQSFSLGVSSATPTPSITSTYYDGPAELPRTFMSTSMGDTPAPGATTFVGAGQSLQTALNNANCGDTIALQAGAVFSGNVTFPARTCDDQHWIVVRTSALDSALPAEGSRMLPCYSGVSSLPGRPAFTCPSLTHALARIVSTATNGMGPIILAPGANHYRFIGVEITRTAGTGIAYQLVSVPTGTADHIILDRVWLHGTPKDDNKNGVNMSGMNYAALIDSYANDFHCTAGTGSCTDAKVVGAGNSTSQDGVFKITNNFLEASGENILMGGASATTTPADIEIRHNHFFKPLTWMLGQPGFVGGVSGNPFIVKNLLELKNAQRVLIEGNIFEYSWGGFSQYGYGLLLTPKNQASGCPICQVTDITIRYNTFSHTGSGISMANVPDDNGAIATAGERYSIHDITIEDVNMKFYNGNGTLFQVDNGWPTGPLNSVSINHITGFPDPSSKIMSLSNDTANLQMYGFTLTNSIIGQALYPIWSASGLTTDCARSDVPVTSLTACFTSYSYNSNAMIAVSLANYPSTKWPADNYFPSGAGAVQFASFNNANGGDYTLLSGSPYKNAGSDGKDLGADIGAIQTATAGVY